MKRRLTSWTVVLLNTRTRLQDIKKLWKLVQILPWRIHNDRYQFGKHKSQLDIIIFLIFPWLTFLIVFCSHTPLWSSANFGPSEAQGYWIAFFCTRSSSFVSCPPMSWAVIFTDQLVQSSLCLSAHLSYRYHLLSSSYLHKRTASLRRS